MSGPMTVWGVVTEWRVPEPGEYYWSPVVTAKTVMADEDETEEQHVLIARSQITPKAQP